MPEFTFDPRLRNGAGGYRDSRGRIVRETAVKAAVDSFIDNSQTVSADLAILLREQGISLAAWQVRMRDHVKEVQTAAAAAALGGFENMSPADRGRLGQRIKVQYQFLDKFAAQLADGSQPLDGRFLVRAQMYSEAGIGTYDRFQVNTMAAAGFDEERSMLEPGANHCPDCEAEAARGWQPIGTIAPIGERLCLTRCRCTKEYRIRAAA